MTFDDIANRFVTARRSATALEGYPGEIPSKLEDSYAIQERAIKLWDRPVIGWKIGRLAPEKQAEHGTERLAGPIFAPTFKDYDGTAVTLPVFTGGFAAVEAEFVFRIAHDSDPAKTEYSEEEALRLIDGVFAGIEMAGSPLATINKLGPTVVASDFGNNFGLILSERLAEFDSWTYGLKLVWTPKPAFQADVAWERYEMSGRDGITAASAFPDASIVTVGFRLSW